MMILGRQAFVEEKRTDVANSTSTHEDTVWVEGLVPGIDFCNHGMPLSLLLHFSNRPENEDIHVEEHSLKSKQNRNITGNSEHQALLLKSTEGCSWARPRQSPHF